VHLCYPSLFKAMLDGDVEAKLLTGVALAPPFAAAFSIGHLIYPEPRDLVDEESGPMSGYFYRRSADRNWKIAIAAGIVAAVNFLCMMITSASM